MEVATPFDIMAETYDEDFTMSMIGQLQRACVWDAISPLLNNKMVPLKILEINCGTGEDAIHFAKLGHQVTATDLSATMIAKAGDKLARLGLFDNNLNLQQCGFNELYKQLGHEQFDLVFSNFGGINCIDEPAMRQLSVDCSNMLKPGGRMVIVAMNSFCLWESAYYIFKGKFKQAFRRLGNKHLLQIGEIAMLFFPYSSRKLKKLVGNEFQFDCIFPIGLTIPPSYLEKQFSTKQGWLHTLNRWEMKLRKWSVLSLLSDHFLVILQKRAK